jgi:hypothetical protein
MVHICPDSLPVSFTATTSFVSAWTTGDPDVPPMTSQPGWV